MLDIIFLGSANSPLAVNGALLMAGDQALGESPIKASAVEQETEVAK